ncbi:MAG: cytochrome c oxidase subunit II [Deltaproteobacteria bacterium]
MRKLVLRGGALLGVWLASPLALATPVVAKGLGLPPDASADGYRIDDLIRETLVFIMFAIMVAWMVVACLLHGRKHVASYVHMSKGGTKVTLAIIGVLVLADGGLYVRSLADMNDIYWNFGAVEKMPGLIRIEVNAHQWAWQGRYAGPDGKFGTPDDIVTLNDFRVPVGKPVLVQLVSTDVIHSLYLPNFRVKQDAMPGMVNKLWFRPTEPGEYEIGCAQHCGVNHYKMRALLTVLPQADYDRWAAEATANSQRGYDPQDPIAHWGWDWNDPKPIEGDVPKSAQADAPAAQAKEL